MSVQVVKLERPNPRQEEFLKCEKKYVAFGGARGGGKSWAVRTKAVLMALKYPGIRILLVRRTMPELESNHLRFLRKQLAGVAEYKAVSRQLVFPGGVDGFCPQSTGEHQGAGLEGVSNVPDHGVFFVSFLPGFQAPQQGIDLLRGNAGKEAAVI